MKFPFNLFFPFRLGLCPCRRRHRHSLCKRMGEVGSVVIGVRVYNCIVRVVQKKKKVFE